jgi:hypothetical protein
MKKNLIIILLTLFSSITYGALDCEEALEIIPRTITAEIKQGNYTYKFVTTHNKGNLNCEEIPDGFKYKMLYASLTQITEFDEARSVIKTTEIRNISFEFRNKKIYYPLVRVNKIPMVLRAQQVDEHLTHVWLMLQSGMILRVNGTHDF